MEPLHPLNGELGMDIGSDKSLDFGIYLFFLLKQSQHLTICDKNKDFFVKQQKDKHLCYILNTENSAIA